jgi:hypothetical protein
VCVCERQETGCWFWCCSLATTAWLHHHHHHHQSSLHRFLFLVSVAAEASSATTKQFLLYGFLIHPFTHPKSGPLLSMQPSEYEIQREVEALRDIRRRSSGPGALLLDPDLPNAPSQTSPNQGYWTSAASPPSLTDGESASSHEGSSISDHDAHGTHHHHHQHDRRNSNDVDEDESAVQLTDQLHLYWVPASMHPEIAPAEFRAFLKEHARTLPADGSPGATGTGVSLSRAGSGASLQSSASLGRKKSMLSRQYKPREGDDDDDDRVVPLKRNKSSLYRSNGPQLGLDDLLKLEALAEEAQTNDDPTKLRTMLRRSLSLNLSPSGMSKLSSLSSGFFEGRMIHVVIDDMMLMIFIAWIGVIVVVVTPFHCHQKQPWTGWRTCLILATRQTHPSSCLLQVRSYVVLHEPRFASLACRVKTLLIGSLVGEVTARRLNRSLLLLLVPTMGRQRLCAGTAMRPRPTMSLQRVARKGGLDPFQTRG